MKGSDNERYESQATESQGPDSPRYADEGYRAYAESLPHGSQARKRAEYFLSTYD